MDTLENTEFTASVRHIARFLKSGIPIYNSKVPDTSGRKTTRRTTQLQIANCKAFSVSRKRTNFIAICVIE